MIAIKGILREEYDRLLLLRQNYFSKMKILPKGSLIIKKRGKKKYLYLSYRNENGKVVSDYVGMFDEMNAERFNSISDEIELRKDLKKKYQNITRQIRELERYVKE